MKKRKFKGRTKSVSPSEAKNSQMKAPSPDVNFWRSVSWVCLGLILGVALIYWQTKNHGFFNIDDDQNIFQCPEVSHGLSMNGIAWAFTHALVGRWTPVTVICNQVACELFGLWAGGHHLVSAFLYAAVAVVLFFALLELTGALWRSAAVAALFAFHPLHVEVVAWISDRSDLLSGIFSFLSLLLYARYARKSRSWFLYVLAVISFALALMGKPSCMMLPFILVLIDYWPLNRFKQNESIICILLDKVPFFMLSAISGVLAMTANKNPVEPFAQLPFFARIGNALVGYVIYLGKILLPVGSGLYPIQEVGWPTWEVVASVVILTIVSVLAFRLRAQKPYLIVGWLCYLLLLVPMIGLIGVSGQLYADRYTFFPKIGILIALVWGIADWSAGWRLSTRRMTLGLTATMSLGSLLLASFIQTSYWKDNRNYWIHRIQGQPEDAIARCNLGWILYQQGDLAGALSQFRAGLKISPNYADGHYVLGVFLLNQGQSEEALAHFKESARIRPYAINANLMLGNIMLRSGRLDEAITYFRTILLYNPKDEAVRGDIISMLRQAGKSDREIQTLLN